MTDSKDRFTDRAGAYVRYRPSYPESIVAAIVHGYEQPRVADLGAGTGISASLLAGCGALVYAVEPNAAMRARIPVSPRITAVDGSAEATTLAGSSVDVVTAFQAYHWFAADAVLAEARRILVAGGRFAAVWNGRDREDPFTGAYESIVDRYDDSNGVHRSERLQSILGDFRKNAWRNVRELAEAHFQPLDADGVIGFARSASYLPKEGARFDAMSSEMRALCARWPGRLGFAWKTRAFLAEPPLE